MARKIEIIQNFSAKHHLRAIRHLEQKNKVDINSYTSLDFITQIIDVARRDKKLTELQNNLTNLIKSCFWKDRTVYISRYAFDPITIPYLHWLKRRNNVIYHSSWPYWDGSRTPKPVKTLTKKQMDLWYNFLEDVKTCLITQKACENLAKQGIESVHMPHSVDTKVFHPLNNKEDNEDSNFKILYVGEWVERKGVDTFLKAIKEADNSDKEYWFVGKGPLEKDIDEARRNYPIKKYGYIDNKEELAEIYRKADVLVLPSKKTKPGEHLYPWEELFGMVIIEAFASGTPVISTNNVGPADIIDDGRTGRIIAERSASELKEEINELSKNSSMSREMGNRARREAEKNYGLEEVSRRWFSVFNDNV